MKQKTPIEAKILALIRSINADEFQEPHTTGDTLDDVYEELLFLEKINNSKKARTEKIIEQISDCYGGNFFNFLPISEAKDELDVFCMGFNTYIEELQNMMVSKTLLETTNKRLIKEKERSESLAKAKDVFLSSMSHEIRTPLNGIIGFIDLLNNNGNFDADSRKQIEFLKLSGDILLVIVNDILDLVKIESGGVVISNRNFDLNILTQLVNQTFRQKFKEKKIEFKCLIDKNVPKILLGDSIRISQILFNLMSNAIKFTPNLGKIELNFQLQSESKTQYYIEFILKDNGIGIKADKLETIFNPFFQITTDSARTNSGLGLGLTIVRKLINLMNGKIKVESEINKGTKVTVVLPFVKPNTSIEESVDSNTLDSKQVLDVYSEAKIKVLLAEDNPINQILVKKVLLKYDIDCVVAANGKLAVEEVEKHDYDIVLMDIMMPIMDGYEASNLIRQLDFPEKNNIPIIALTAIITGNVIEDCMAVGIDRYLSKPFDSKVLMNTIFELIKQRKVANSK